MFQTQVTLKEKDLRDAAECALCHKRIGHTGMPLFYRVTIERFGVDLRAVQRQGGLEQMLGNVMLAQVMGPNDDMAKAVMQPVRVSVCEECSTLKSVPLVVMIPEVDEAIEKRDRG